MLLIPRSRSAFISRKGGKKAKGAVGCWTLTLYLRGAGRGGRGAFNTVNKSPWSTRFLVLFCSTVTTHLFDERVFNINWAEVSRACKLNFTMSSEKTCFWESTLYRPIMFRSQKQLYSWLTAYLSSVDRCIFWPNHRLPRKITNLVFKGGYRDV